MSVSSRATNFLDSLPLPPSADRSDRRSCELNSVWTGGEKCRVSRLTPSSRRCLAKISHQRQNPRTALFSSDLGAPNVQQKVRVDRHLGEVHPSDSKSAGPHSIVATSHNSTRQARRKNSRVQQCNVVRPVSPALLRSILRQKSQGFPNLYLPGEVIRFRQVRDWVWNPFCGAFSLLLP